jgi:hypothetical protein
MSNSTNTSMKCTAVATITVREGDPMSYQVFNGSYVILDDIARIEYYCKYYVNELKDQIKNLEVKVAALENK